MQELVIESLVVSLAMVVFYVLVDETTQMPLAERDHACETLLFDRPDEPLGIGVGIGTLRRQPNRLNTGALQDLAKDPRIEGIAVVNQMARPAQTAIDRVGQIAGLLLHPRAARLRVDPGDGHAAGSQLDHEEDEVPPEPRQRQHLDGEQIAGRQALPVRLQERLPGHVPAPLGRRVDSVVVQDPLHRGPGDSVAEVRERAADPRVAPPRIVDRHPDHELGDVLSGHWSTSTSAGAAIVFLGDQSPVPTQDRIRGDDARDLRQDPPAEFVTAHSESTTLGVRQAKRPRAQVFSEDPILLPEIVDQIVLVTVHPASEREDEELQRRRHSLRLLGGLDQHRPSLGRPLFRTIRGTAVVDEIERAILWRAIVSQERRIVIDGALPSVLEIEPATAVVGLTRWTPNDAAAVVDADSYSVVTRDPSGTIIAPAPGYDWPAPARTIGSFALTYTCGWTVTDDSNTVPASVQLMVERAVAFRAGSGLGGLTIGSLKVNVADSYANDAIPNAIANIGRAYQYRPGIIAARP